ncbi:hypothetical protein BpHYR1_013110 [Brachionus plicatilis]|uniref:Uncharacterized protein n=1 Tax=Brachionus plicatilis TaxID=10195 RepID=A0A3M7S033_BRAPC|nr:hypothetical protein BpHYR1_013110 [Brachionus plicatilis]
MYLDSKYKPLFFEETHILVCDRSVISLDVNHLEKKFKKDIRKSLILKPEEDHLVETRRDNLIFIRKKPRFVIFLENPISVQINSTGDH